MDLYTELELKLSSLDKSVKMLRKTGEAYALAEKDYKIALRQECLKLRDEGTAIGIISLTCYGIPSIAELRFKRDVAESIYKANIESINVLKLELRLIEGQINREYGISGKGDI